MNTCLYFPQTLSETTAILQQDLQLDIRCLAGDAIRLADLMDESTCRQVLQNFAARIHAKKMTCASSLFIKYWATIWILPFLYCHADSLPFIGWSSAGLAVNLPVSWHWDRTLQLVEPTLSSLQIMSLNDIENMLGQFNPLFQQLAKVGHVPYALLWENAAVRVVQFYQSQARQDLSKAKRSRLQQQIALLKAKSGESFNLAENPFISLWNNWFPNNEIYMRKKCCFYFQLEEAGQTLCRNCPLQLKEMKESKS